VAAQVDAAGGHPGDSTVATAVPGRAPGTAPAPAVAPDRDGILTRVTTVSHEPRPRDAGVGRVDISVVIPCLNEEENIEACVAAALAGIASSGLTGEVVVADNDSDDRSAELAEASGARVVRETRRGYGSAYMAGFAAARGDIIVMGDADLTYDFGEIPRFVALIREEGADLVMGDRMDNIQPGAMPWLHRYIGNPLLSGFLNLLYRTGVRDAHCGMRAFRRDRLEELDLRTPGMEFASEMVIRAAKVGLTIAQVPIEYHPRGGTSKLSTFRDGWRHLRFLLVHSPVALFIIPGLVLAVLGALVMLTVLAQVNVFGREWELHSLMGGALLLIAGTQIMSFGVIARTYAFYYMSDGSRRMERLRSRFRLEHGLILGTVVTLVGVAMLVWLFVSWATSGFGSLGEERLAVLGATIVVVGLQILFASFVVSILGIRRPRS
jgi:glycosyltransferase involved in cell wall biosynthesis